MSALQCRACGNELSRGARFCSSCGVKVESENIHTVERESDGSQAAVIVCRNCGSENDPELSYCENCGTRLGPAVTRQSVHDSPRKKQPAKKGAKGKKRTRIESWHIAIILAAVSVILIVLYFIVGNERDVQLVRTPAGMTLPDTTGVEAEIQRLENSVRINPRDPDARLKLANALHDARRFTPAITEYRNYLQMKPLDVDAIVDMGICFFEMGDLQSARSEMEKGLLIDPTHQLAHYNLGIVSLQERNIGEARKWFEKTVAIDSTTKIAKRAQMMLQQHSFPVTSK